jgi:hypothetical protein
MSCITMILHWAFICILFKIKIYCQIIIMKYCKWCKYKFKLTLLLFNAENKLKWVCFFIYPHNCNGQCYIVIALVFTDVAKGGGGGCRRILPEIWTSMLKIYLKCNNYNRAFYYYYYYYYYCYWKYSSEGFTILIYKFLTD